MSLDSAYDMAHAGDVDGIRSWLQGHFDDLNGFVRDGYSLLHVACMFGHETLARFLLDQQALVNLNAANQSRALPIHLAVSFRDEDVADRLVRLLIANGSELNGMQAGGQTALHHAVGRGSVKLARTLIEEGADPFLKDENGKSPSSLAKELSDENHGSEIREALAMAFS